MPSEHQLVAGAAASCPVNTDDGDPSYDARKELDDRPKQGKTKPREENQPQPNSESAGMGDARMDG